jgi:hypothetical protein
LRWRIASLNMACPPDVGESMFVTMGPVAEEDLVVLKEYLRQQYTAEASPSLRLRIFLVDSDWSPPFPFSA